jgi:hypothetical protein
MRLPNVICHYLLFPNLDGKDKSQRITIYSRLSGLQSTEWLAVDWVACSRLGGLQSTGWLAVDWVSFSRLSGLQ